MRVSFVCALINIKSNSRSENLFRFKLHFFSFYRTHELCVYEIFDRHVWIKNKDWTCRIKTNYSYSTFIVLWWPTSFRRVYNIVHVSRYRTQNVNLILSRWCNKKRNNNLRIIVRVLYNIHVKMNASIVIGKNLHFKY